MAGGSGSGSVSLTALGVAYTQDFDTLATSGSGNTTLPTGWYFYENGTGTNADGMYVAGNGSSSAGNVYSFGTGTSTDRAFGSLANADVQPTLGAQFTNNTGHVIGALTVSYVGEEWRKSDNWLVDKLDFAYSTSGAADLTSGSWIEVVQLAYHTTVFDKTGGATDGNNANFQLSRNYTISGLSIADGETVWIRWADWITPGNDYGMGIDNFSITPLVAPVDVTRDTQLTGDADSDGQADPGDTLLHTIVITNTSGMTADNVIVNDPLGGSTPTGTINISPIAFDDSYTAVGNTALRVGGAANIGSGPSLQLTGTLLDNDSLNLAQDDVPGGTVDIITGGVSAHGTYNIDSDGSFSYIADAGYTGSDSFTYTVRDKGLDGIAGTADDLTSTATVDITVKDMVWYVDSAAKAGKGEGTSANPFKTIDEFKAAPSGTGDTIYIQGNAAAASILNLETDQRLIGQGVDLEVGGFTLATATANSSIEYSGTFYAVNLKGNNSANSNEVAGLTINAPSGSGLAGVKYGHLDVDKVSVNSAKEAIYLAGEFGTTNTSSVSGNFTSVTSTGGQWNVAFNTIDGSVDMGTGALSGATTWGIYNANGNVGLTYAGSLQHSGSGQAVLVANQTGGTNTFTGDISANGSSNAVQIFNNTGTTTNFSGKLTLDSSASTQATFYVDKGGTVSATGSGSTLVSGPASPLYVNNSTIGPGGLIFESISATGGLGILLRDTGTQGGLTVTGKDANNDMVADAGSGGTLASITGTAVFAQNAVNLNLAGMTITNPTGVGIYGINLGGVSSISGVTIQNHPNGASAIAVENTNTNLDALTISNTTVSGSGTSFTGVWLREIGTSNLNVKIDKSTFSGIAQNSVLLFNDAGASGTTQLTVSNSTFQNSTGGSISLNPSANTSLIADINGNTLNNIRSTSGTAAISFIQTTTGSSDVTIRNNTVTDIANENAIIATINSGQAEIAVRRNTIEGLGNAVAHAIQVNATGTASVDAGITYNDLGTIAPLWTVPATGYGILAQAYDAATLDLILEGNEVIGSTAITSGIFATSSGMLNATVLINVFYNKSATSVDAFYAGLNTATANYNLSLVGNNAPGDPDFVIVSGSGGLDISQASLADLNTVNFGTVTVAGPVTYGAPFPTLPTGPSLPTLPLFVASEPVVTTIEAEHSDPGATTDGSTGQTATPVDDGILSQAELDLIAEAAIARWAAAGASEDQLAAMRGVALTVADLGGRTLGTSSAGTITLDDNAAGFNWFIDATPGEDSEFTGEGSELTAVPGTPAATRVDLLTTVMHELGHQIGLTDAYDPAAGDTLMSGTIDPGERRLPDAQDLSLATGAPVLGTAFALSPISLGSIPDGQTVTIQFESIVDGYTNQIIPSFSNQTTVDYELAAVAKQVTSNTETLAPDNSADIELDSLTIGDRVFRDIDHNGLFDGGSGDFGIGGVALTLFADDGTTPGEWDAGDTLLATTTTSLSSGVYGFPDLAPGDYVVRLDASNFTKGGPLEGLVPTSDPTDPDDDIGNDNNGLQIGDAVYSYAVTIDYDIEVGPPIGKGNPPPGNVNSTLDFGLGDPLLTIDDVTVDEGAGTATFTISMNGTIANGVTVDFATALDTAEVGDFVATSGTATILAGKSNTTVAVSITDDSTDEPDDTFFVNLTNAVNATILDDQGLGTITDNDAPPTVSVNDATANEGSVAPFIFTLSAASELPIEFYATTADGTALAPGDYTAADLLVTLSAGQTSTSAIIPTKHDTLYEGDETFFLNLSKAVNVTILDGQGKATITDNDTAPTLSIDDVTVDEGAGTATFTITQSAISGLDTTVDFATALDTAEAADFVETKGTATILAGKDSTTVTVTINEDATDEPDDTFFVNLSNPTNATILDSQGLGTITDNDAPPTISVSDATVTEGDAGIVSAKFEVSLSAASELTVEADVATADGTALSPGDYIGGSAHIKFAPGTTMVSVLPMVNGDTLYEGDETFFLNVTNPVNASILDGQGEATITNDDTPPSLSIDDVTVDEGAGTATFTITQSAISDLDTTVKFATALDTAEAGDFVATSGTATIAAGKSSTTVTVTINEDLIDEPDDTFFVNLSNAVNASISDGQGLGTITDNDLPPTISVNDVTVGEGEGLATFTLSLSLASELVAVATYATSDGTAIQPGDYLSKSGNVTFAIGETSKQVSVVIEDDTLLEPDETFTFSITSGTNLLAGDLEGTGTILDDDLNNPPSGADRTVTGAEDAPLLLNLSDFGFNDIDGNAFAAVRIASLPGAGVLSLSGTPVTVGLEVSVADIAAGKLTFRPEPDAYGSPYSSFTFQVRDDGGTAGGGVDLDPTPNTATVYITPVNDDPVARDDIVSTNEDTALTLLPAVLLGNDSDVDGAGLSLVSVSGASHGTAVFDGTRVVFTPEGGFSGVAGFDYAVSDGLGGSDSAHVLVSVLDVNKVPVVPATNAVVTDEDVATGVIAIGGSDPDGDPLGFDLAPYALPGRGTVSFTGGGFVYTPNPDENGSDGFVVLIDDGRGGYALQAVSVTINPVNDAPVAGDDAVAGTGGVAGAYPAGVLLANDVDIDGDTLAVSAVSGPSHGTVSLAGGVVTFTPDAAFAGTAGFDYTVSDGHGGSDTGRVTVTVAPGSGGGDDNHSPELAAGQALVTIAGTGIAFTVDASDPDGDPLTTTPGSPAHGSLAMVDGRWVYTPDAGYLGADSFAMTVSDGRGGVAVQTVAVSVVALPEAGDWQLYASDGFEGEVGGSGLVVGTAGYQAITVSDLAGTVALDPSWNGGGDFLCLIGAADAWSMVRFGSGVILTDGDTFVVVPAGPGGMTVAFDDGLRTLAVESGAIRLGGQQATGTLAHIAALPEDIKDLPEADPAALARLYLAEDASATAGGRIDVIGTNGHEHLTMLFGTFGLDPSWNGGGDSAGFDDPSTTFAASRFGSAVLLAGADTTATIPVGQAGTTLAFSDASATLAYDPLTDQLTIATQIITTTPMPLTFA